MADQNHKPKQNEFEEPDEPRITELVAYLDGELSEQDADRVEELLLTNPPLRKDAESLDRTWQLLDSLEEATASGEFTQRTLASIAAVSASDDSNNSHAAGWSLRNILPTSLMTQGLVWCLAAFVACSTGLLLSRKVRHERTDPVDAQILRNLDLYREYPKLWRVPDVQFLQQVCEDADPVATVGENP